MTPSPTASPAPADDTTKHAGNTPYRLLDAWRGVAALWVVMLHLDLPSTPAFIHRLSTGGFLGVPMFFVISGYCIASAASRSALADRPVLHFLRARIRRIYPPYFFAVLCAAALSLLLSFLVRHHLVASSQIAAIDLRHQSWQFYLGMLTVTQFPLHTTLIIRVLWSLSYEVAFYGIVALLLLASTRLRRLTPFLLDGLALLTVMVLLWLALAFRTCPFPWNRWPEFGLGALVYQVLAQPGRRLPKIAFFLASLLIIIGAVEHRQDNFVHGISGAVQTLFYLGFAGLLLALFRWDSRLYSLPVVRTLSWVGLFSYSLYLIHLLALGLVTQGLNRIAGVDAHPLLLYFIKLGVCIAAGRLFFQVCERPFLDSRQRQARQEAARQKANAALAPSPEAP